MEIGDKLITPQDVVAKLKDDGDFDRLRLQIIQKLKEDDDLRNSIATVVKQSSVLYQEGIENMKPRQVSDAIRADVGDRLMSQLSEGIWKIIRDEDGMKKEINKTIESVYNRMLNPDYQEEGVDVFSPSQNVLPSQNETVVSSVNGFVDRGFETALENVVSEPPGFSSCVNTDKEFQDERMQMPIPQGVQVDLKNEKLNDSRDATHRNGQTVSLVPLGSELTQSGDCGDEDPDLPPGFG